MKRLLVIPLLLILVGCATPIVIQSERQALAAAEISFTRVLNDVAFQKQAGTITQAEVDRLKPYADATRTALDIAQARVLVNQPLDATLDAAQAALRALILQQQRKATP